MRAHISAPPPQTKVWQRVFALSSVLFFIFLSDAILSYWAPAYFAAVFKDTRTVGYVMAASSLVGLIADLTLPQIIKGLTVRRLIIIGIVFAYAFASTLLVFSWAPYVVVALLSMAIWGVYYELLAFAQQQFVGTQTPPRFHAAVWGFLGMFKSTAYFIGPWIASVFLGYGPRLALYVAMSSALVAAIVLSIHHASTKHVERTGTSVHLLHELSHWASLIHVVWPVFVLSIVIGMIDAFFWTIGPVWAEVLIDRGEPGNLLMPLYVLPSIVMSFVVAKWGIWNGKKRRAESLLLGAGLCLVSIQFVSSTLGILVAMTVASMLFFAAWPLVDGVYSDFVGRMKHKGKHMMGLSSSTLSIAYIIGPIVAGFLAEMGGMQYAFSLMGGITVAIAVGLLVVTPKKIKLPQNEIKTWE